MIFAVVEREPGVLEPVVLLGAAGARLRCRRLTGEVATCAPADVVHAGMTGDERSAPATFQWAPAWATARLRAAGVAPLAARAAANPSERSVKQGFVYQSSDTGALWTPGARRDRWKEQALYRAAMRPEERRWSALDYVHVFGYDRVKQFIEAYRRRETKPESFFWCMIFAALTAAENTNTAEQNLAGFAQTLARRLASETWEQVAETFTFAEFRRKGSGFQEQRYETLLEILRRFRAIRDFLAENPALHDRPLRDALLAQFPTPGLGITKLSFALECYGEDVACLDRWMLRALGAPEKVGGRYALRASKTSKGPLGRLAWANRAIAAHERHWRKLTAKGEREKGWPKDVGPRYFARIAPPPWEPFTDGAYVLQRWGGRFSGRTEGALKEYEFFEDQLARTDYYRYAVLEGAPNPLCRAQWTMWEDILRRHPDPKTRKVIADHRELFLVIEGREAIPRMTAAAHAKGARRAPQAPLPQALLPAPAPNPLGSDAALERWRAASGNVTDAVSLLRRTEKNVAPALAKKGDTEEVRDAQRVARQQVDAVEETTREAIRLRSNLERSLFFAAPAKAAAKSLPRPAT